MLLLAGSLAQAASMKLGAGASASLGSGKAELGCGNLEVAGTLSLGNGSVGSVDNVVIDGAINANSGAISFGGDWVNNGGFNAGSSQVTLGDECSDGSSAVVGDTTFHDFSILSGSGKQVSWQAGSTTGVVGDLVLRGAGGNLLGLLSSAAGQRWFLILNEGGSQDISYVSVRDSYASLPGQHLAPGSPEAFDSTDGGSNFRWFLNGLSFPVPAVNAWGLLLLMASILASALLRRRRASQPGA